MSELVQWFRPYCVHEWGFSTRTADTYSYDVLWITRIIGDHAPDRIRPEHVLALKSRMAERGAGPARIRRLLNSLKCFLRFCRLALSIETMDTKQIRGPRLPRREVVFLTPEEMRSFLSAIPIVNREGRRRSLDLGWLCFRTVVEVLRGTGLRISEALSLTRSAVDFEKGEARVIGKGNRERTVYFSAAALGWLKEYLNRRRDTKPWLFALPSGRRLQVKPVQHRFKKVRDRAGIKKKVTAHILRHTFATTLQMNGAPIGIIKDLLGHEQLETTCKFYLGTDKRLLKGTVDRYLNYDYDADFGIAGH